MEAAGGEGDGPAFTREGQENGPHANGSEQGRWPAGVLFEGVEV